MTYFILISIVRYVQKQGHHVHYSFPSTESMVFHLNTVLLVLVLWASLGHGLAAWLIRIISQINIVTSSIKVMEMVFSSFDGRH